MQNEDDISAKKRDSVRKFTVFVKRMSTSNGRKVLAKKEELREERNGLHKVRFLLTFSSPW